jgi:hypothetical protein
MTARATGQHILDSPVDFDFTPRSLDGGRERPECLSGQEKSTSELEARRLLRHRMPIEWLGLRQPEIPDIDPRELRLRRFADLDRFHNVKVLPAIRSPLWCWTPTARTCTTG